MKLATMFVVLVMPAAALVMPTAAPARVSSPMSVSRVASPPQMGVTVKTTKPGGERCSRPPIVLL
jgi:hypothetical protein